MERPAPVPRRTAGGALDAGSRGEGGSASAVPLARDLALVALAKAAVSALVLALGFRAVSDDDFARVVLAQEWAHAPRLDPPGTSWLPVPVWIYGALVGGASLDAAGFAKIVDAAHRLAERAEQG